MSDRLKLWSRTGVWQNVLKRLFELNIIDEDSILVDLSRYAMPDSRESSMSSTEQK